MLPCFITRNSKNTIEIKVIVQSDYATWIAKQSASIKQWLNTTQFKGDPGTFSIVPNSSGTIQFVLCGGR